MTEPSDLQAPRVLPAVRVDRNLEGARVASRVLPTPVPERMERDMASPKGFTVETDEPAGDGVVIRIKGELDLAAAPELVDAIVDSNESPRVSLDLSGVTFLDSSAIGALVAAGRALAESGRRLEVGPRSDIVTRVLEITGLTDSAEAFDVLPEEQ